MQSGLERMLLCLFVLVIAVPAAMTGAQAAAPAQTQETIQSESTTFEVQLLEDGDARWHVSTQFRLDDANDTAAFNELAASFERGEADVTYEASTFRRAAAAAATTTEREMEIRAVERTATTTTVDGQQVGRLQLSFRWAGFAETTGDTYRLGDAFNTSDGTWFPGLASGQELIIRPPEGYSVETAPVPVESGVLQWSGQRSFEPGYLGQITYTDSQVLPPGQSGGIPIGLLGGIILLIAVGVAAGVLWRRNGDTDDDDVNGESPTTPPASSASSNSNENASEETPDATGATDTESELLSDEERVLRLLEANGGRMKQANIVEETDWSNAKVSQLLSAMDEADDIEKLRIGRENLISLPGENVGDIEDAE